jgi:uncharacterized membrane protein YcaP (DUF421 family)
VDHSIVWLRAAGVLLVVYAGLQMAFMARNEKQERDTSGIIRYEGLPLPLIVDGKVQDGNLAKIGQTRFWLKNRIQELGARKFHEISVCTIDHRGKLYLCFYDFTAKSN